MKHEIFSIGLELWCGGKCWRCTELGTRVIVAISLEPREMVQVETDPGDKSNRIKTRFISNDPPDVSGPPYGIVENVFDEYDLEGCKLGLEGDEE
jgi:hypothetical protein